MITDTTLGPIIVSGHPEHPPFRTGVTPTPAEELSPPTGTTHLPAVRCAPLPKARLMTRTRVWSGRPLSRASWAAALTVVAAITAFLALTSPGHGHAAAHPDYAVAV
jgi:hypothetical protein